MASSLLKVPTEENDMKGCILVAAMFAAAAAGCYMTMGDPNASNTNNTNNNNNTSSTDASTTTASDLPCDVAAVLQSTCTSCHSNPPIGGAPMSLLSYADLTAKDLTDPTKTVAEQCVVRMQSATTPMPPGGGATTSDVQTIQNWITAGYPQGTCGGGDDAGTNYNTPLVCTSGVTNHSSDIDYSMHPGGACNTCHAQQGDGPKLSIGGTVYPTAHEPDDCSGVGNGVAQVVIMDVNGNTQLTLSTNAAGNFHSTTSIKTPYRAKVVSNGKTREMVATQTDGNCNSCHTVNGANGAPGRIMLP